MDRKPEGRLLDIAQTVAWWGALFGGMLLFFHFLAIGYLPTFDLSSLMGTIAGVAVLGLLLCLAIVVMFAFPGAALIFASSSGVIPGPPARSTGVADAEEKKRRRAIALPWASGCAVAILGMGALIWFDVPRLAFSLVLWVTPSIWLLLWVGAEAVGWKPLAKGSKLAAVFYFLTFLFFGTFSFVCLTGLSAGVGSKSTWNLIWLALAIWLAQGIVYFSQGMPWKQRAGLLGIIIFQTLLVTPLSNAYTQQIGRAFRFGMMGHTELIVTQRGCAIMQMAGAACSPSGGSEGVFLSEPVDVWTRIGTDSLLSAVGDLGHRECPRFLVPNSEILGLRLAQPLTKEEVTEQSARDKAGDTKGCPSLVNAKAPVVTPAATAR